MIGRWWFSHHRLHDDLGDVDVVLVALNFIVLGFVAFLPFATRILRRYPTDATVVAIYGGANAADGLGLVGMRFYARRTGFVDAAVPVQAHSDRTEPVVIAAAIFTVSIPVALSEPAVRNACGR